MFRVYDTLKKEYPVDQDRFHLNNSGELECLNELHITSGDDLLYTLRKADSARYLVERSISLPDIAGKTIFENDAVEHKGRKKRRCIVKKDGDRWAAFFDLENDWKPEFKAYSLRSSTEWAIVGTVHDGEKQ